MSRRRATSDYQFHNRLPANRSTTEASTQLIQQCAPFGASSTRCPSKTRRRCCASSAARTGLLSVALGGYSSRCSATARRATTRVYRRRRRASTRFCYQTTRMKTCCASDLSTRFTSAPLVSGCSKGCHQHARGAMNCLSTAAANAGDIELPFTTAIFLCGTANSPL